MLPDKGTKNLSELKNFFTTSEKTFFPVYNILVNNKNRLNGQKCCSKVVQSLILSTFAAI